MIAKPAIHVDVLPATLCREIGRIISRWAFLENYVQRIVWTLMGISREEGRLAVREPRLEDRVEVITDLMRIYELKVDDKLTSALLDGIRKQVHIRDAVAHGAWSFSDDYGDWQVTNTKGTWDRQDRPKIERKKKINPEGILLGVAALKKRVAAIDDLISNATILHDSIVEQIAALRETPPPALRRLPHLRAQRPPALETLP